MSFDKRKCDCGKLRRTSHGDRQSPVVATVLVAVAAFLLFGLNNTVTTAVPAWAMGLGSGPFAASLLNSLFVLIAVLLRIPLERVVLCCGSRFAMIAGALGYTVPCLFLAVCSNFWQSVLLRLLQAFGLALFQPSIAQYLAATMPASLLGRMLGVVRFSTTASLMIGPAIMLPLAQTHGYGAFFGVLFFVGACGTVAALALPRDVIAAQTERSKDETIKKNSAENWSYWRRIVLLVAPFVLALGYSSVMNFGQMLSRQFLTNMNDGILFAFFGMGGLVGNMIAGWACDRFSAKRPIACIIAASVVGLLLLGLCPFEKTILLGAFLCGVGYSGATTALIAEMGRFPGQRKSSFLARQQSALDVGVIIGGAFAGLMVQSSQSASAPFLVMSVITAAGLFAWSMLYPNEGRA